MINYENSNTIRETYLDASVYLSKKYSNGEDCNIRYNDQHCSYNILDVKKKLMVSLKFNYQFSKFFIATCFFPSIYQIRLFSPCYPSYKKDKLNEINYMMYDVNKDNNQNIFEKSMSEILGSNSIEYKILFSSNMNDDTNYNIWKSNLKLEIDNYLCFMENIIKTDEDRKYYFVFNDGIEFVIKILILYKIKDNDYIKYYKRLLNIDLNNSYKNAFDICKKYLEGENL